LTLKIKNLKILWFKFTNNSYKFNEFWLALTAFMIINKTKPILFDQHRFTIELYILLSSISEANSICNWPEASNVGFIFMS
jgi:hypothetical protein